MARQGLPSGVNREVLMLLLRQSWPDSTVDERRVVARAAGDLADSRQYREDAGSAIGPQTLVEELADAPDEHSLVERWNWWIGSLEAAYGGYRAFSVHSWDAADIE
jgi:hypothetical protein